MTKREKRDKKQRAMERRVKKLEREVRDMRARPPTEVYDWPAHYVYPKPPAHLVRPKRYPPMIPVGPTPLPNPYDPFAPGRFIC